MTWLIFALMTGCSWGVYGVLLHSGQVAMADPVNGRYKAFLFVGVAYTLTAVIGSAVVRLAVARRHYVVNLDALKQPGPQHFTVN